jgi:hypothetical protein
LFDHGSALAVGDVWTIGRPFCSSNRQSLIPKRAGSHTISS